MKRSKMVEKLAKKLILSCINNYLSIPTDDAAKIMADSVLTSLEKMDDVLTPPKSKKIDLGCECGCRGNCTYYGWEPEYLREE